MCVGTLNFIFKPTSDPWNFVLSGKREGGGKEGT
jgi:hypothetical protein